MLETRIKKALIKLGFDFSHVGSFYIITVIKKILEVPEFLHSLKNTIYEEIAKNNGVSVGAVDRDIRWALNKAYEKGALGQLTIFKDRNAPTVKEFINLFFDYIINIDYFSIN